MPLSGAPDIVAHEFTHAVTDNTAELEYVSISGALNEAFSDIFGALAENAPTSEAFYRIGERVWRDGPALRDMANPGKYGMPSKMSQYKHIGEEDQGGIHVNCSIPCMAFFAMGQSLSREQLADIWFSALRDYLTTYSDFWDAREATVQAATAIYGASAASTVEAAWDSAGVTAVNPDTHGDTLDQATRYNYGDTVYGSIDWAGDFDCFVFTPTAGGTYSFYTTGSTDTLGAIMDTAGDIIAIDDDLGAGKNFRVSTPLQKNNTYYLVIRHYDDYGHGSYTLRCSAVIDPVTNMSVNISPSSAGEIKQKVTIQADAGPETAEYQFQVKRNTTSRWTTLQSYHRNDTVYWTPETIGTYDIRVRARSVGRTSDYDQERLYTYEAKDIPSLTGVLLTADGGTERQNCTPIALTATPQGAESETGRGQYLFRAKTGKTWTVIRDWGVSRTYEWTPEKTGTYTIEVQARTQGRTGTDAADSMDFTIITPPPLSKVNLSVSGENPQEINTQVTLTATPEGNPSETCRAQYLFRVKRGSTWSTLQGWGPGNEYTWTPTKTGDYTIEVQARTKGRTATDHIVQVGHSVVHIFPLIEVKLSSTEPGMQPVGTEVRLTAVAQGRHADKAEYLFQYSTDGRKWRSIGDGKWGNSEAAYAPDKDAVYQFRVQARSVGRGGVDVADTISQRFYKGPMPVEDVSLTVVNPADIQETGKSVRLEAAAQGFAAGDAEYLFRVKRGSQWKTVRGWEKTAAYDWIPDREGNYTIEVQARAQGRTSIDATDDTAYTVANIFPLTGVTLRGAPSGMRVAGTEITLEAMAEGPYADTAQYAFQYSTDERKWYSIQGFSGTSAVVYTPKKEAVYLFRVQARSAGRSGVDVASIFDQRFYVGGPMPVESVSLDIAPPDTQEVALTTALSAAAYGMRREMPSICTG